MNLTFKKCDLNDLELLTNISRDTFIHAFEKQNNPEDFKTYIDLAFNKTQIKNELLNVNSEFYFGYLDNEIVGYFKLNEKEEQAELLGDLAIELSRIYVIQEFQGKKLGVLFLKEIIKIALKKHKVFLWLGVWEQNVNAIRFYEREGFKKFNTHSFFIGNDEQTDWLMRLDLV